MRTLSFAAVSLLVAATLLVAGCSAPPSASPASAPPAATTAPPAASTPGAAGTKVKIVKLDADPCVSWDPCQVKVKAGTTVTWENNDVIAHDVTFVDGPEKPKSGAPGSLDPGKSWSYKFDTPGTYEWYCAIHHPLMHKPGTSPKLVVE